MPTQQGMMSSNYQYPAGVISYASADKSKPPITSTTQALAAIQQPQSAQGGTTANNVPGGLMGQFNDLLKQRQGIQNDKMTLQEQQLQKINTQKNNTAFQNSFASRSNLVDIMRKLLETSRQATAQQSRVFM